MHKIFWIFLFTTVHAYAQKSVSKGKMQSVYEEVKTPYKYGLVMVPEDDSKKMDCPSIFKKGKSWYMVYIVYDGRGYETWLAKSEDLLKWNTLGKMMSFGDSTGWDGNQKAGYISLQNLTWGGNYAWQPYQGKYWMSYIGGNAKGYEAGVLSIGLANTTKDPTVPHEWNRLPEPVLRPVDKDARWYDNSTQYKSSIIWDKTKKTGHPFVMYFNARGDSLKPARGAERISMAVSDDMQKWKRFGTSPVINHHVGISGDAVIQKMGDLYIMFYFGAFWKDTPKGAAFNRFACSYDLVNWTEWDGSDLIASSEPYDKRFAHKSCVVKYNGTVYHFYCAVDEKDQRGIAVATSKELGKSGIEFKGKK